MTITTEARAVEDFKVGDIVVLDTTGFNAAIPEGSVGEVVEIEGNFIDVEFIHPDTLKTVRLPAYANEIVPQPEPESHDGFTVGNRVRFTDVRFESRFGNEGTVTGFNTQTYGYDCYETTETYLVVKFDNGDFSKGFLPSRYTRILTDAERASLGYPVGISVGDRVQHDMGTEFTGTVTEVRDTDRNNVSVLWDEGAGFIGGGETATLASSLTVLPAKPEFKVGDRVIRVSEKHTIHADDDRDFDGIETGIGSIGTVDGDGYLDGRCICVRWDEGTALVGHSTIGVEQVEHYEPIFREGDEVIVHKDAKTVNNTGVHFGKEVSGTVTEVTGTGNVLVTLPNSFAQYVAPKYVRHILVGEIKGEPEVVSNDELLGATVEDAAALRSLPNGTILAGTGIYGSRVKAGGRWLYLSNANEATLTPMLAERGEFVVEYIAA